MAIGVFDLSIITDTLLTMLKDCRDHSPLFGPGGVAPFHIEVGGASPETARTAGGCQLSLYLFHITENKFQKNSFWSAQGQHVAGVPPVRFQPMSLDLYYLLTAYAYGDYLQEQRAMSIAIRCFHDHPRIKASAAIPEDLCLMLEVEAADELGRLWQSFAIAFRLAVVYKVTVAFITPEETPPPTRKPETIILTADPATLPFESPQLLGTMRVVRYQGPHTDGMPDERRYTLSPAIGAPGQTVNLLGGNLTQTGFEQIYLSSQTFVEQRITDWKVQPTPAQADTWLTLQLPANPGPIPGGTPPAGVYQLQVGSDPAGKPPIRSNATPFSIAALVNAGPAPSIAPVGGTYTVLGKGFLDVGTEVLLESVGLRRVTGGLTAGTFRVDAADTITFQRPTDLPDGRYAVRVRVNGVESDPAVWISVP